MLGRGPAGEPGGGKVGAAPEELHRARLADEPAAELEHDAMGLLQGEPEPVRGVSVVRAMELVFRKRDGHRDSTGLG